MQIQRLRPPIERFKSNLSKRESGCIEWTGHTIKSNGRESHRYGRLNVNKVSMLAHRYAYVLAKGEIPAGMNVCHSCDNTICCNPDHLFLGTQLQNMADMKAKGRSHKEAPCKGEAHPRAKLKESDVVAIRVRYESGESITSMSKEYGVTGVVLWKAATKRTWKHVK